MILLCGALVMTTFDIGFLQFYSELVSAVGAGDFVLGIVKAAVFGITIAAIGCQRGLATGAGASARKSIGITVFSGMLASTCLAVLFVPAFFVVVQRFENWRAERKKKAPAAETIAQAGP